jgi:hypothetical protein
MGNRKIDLGIMQPQQVKLLYMQLSLCISVLAVPCMQLYT